MDHLYWLVSEEVCSLQELLGLGLVIKRLTFQPNTTHNMTHEIDIDINQSQIEIMKNKKAEGLIFRARVKW